MSEGMIPVDSLQIDAPPLEESGVYNVMLRRFTVSLKASVKGVLFGACHTEVVDGDFEGANLSNNYIPLPVLITEDMSKGEKYRYGRQNETFARFAKSFGLKGDIPTATFQRPESLKAFEEWMQQFEGNTGKVTIRNQEFPAGSGRMRSGINDFVF